MKPAVLAMVLFLFSSSCSAQVSKGDVEKSGFASKVTYERIISGHLKELNGKYKLRVTETVYQPGGHIGEHHHVGPGIRYVVSGELTYVQPDSTRIFRTGDYFYESGDVTHTAFNRTKNPIVILNFEILPATWQGASTVLPFMDGHQ